MATLSETVDILRLFADPTRVRLVALLDGNELSVAEITQITELPQSGVSTHLGKLRDAGVLRDRRQGVSTYYTMNEGTMPETVRRLWNLFGENQDAPLLSSDRARCQEILRARQKTGSWAESVAGQMDRHYSPGRTWEATMFGFMSYITLGDVLDAGSGDGTVATLLAPRSKSVTCLDLSPKVLQAAQGRLSDFGNIRFAHGDIHALPFPDSHFDHVLLLHVLTYAKDPTLALREAARVLRPRGDLLVTTLAHHDHADVTAPYGHVNQGFRPRTLHGWLTRQAGLQVKRCEVTSHEKRPPHFAVISAFARKPDSLRKQDSPPNQAKEIP
jgi:ubiquinone/menaquinone biosynthesis C-methylase UbiE/DNA-binding transcriptional ArsR family regulator